MQNTKVILEQSYEQILTPPIGMVPDETVHMVTSKRHNTDEKHPYGGARLSVDF